MLTLSLPDVGPASPVLPWAVLPDDLEEVKMAEHLFQKNKV